MNKLQVGVVGLGFMGEKHANVYRDHLGTELKAVTDISAERLEDWDRVTPQLTLYQDYEEMFSEEELDAVSIATPETLHVEPVKAAAENNVDILLEKPLAHNLEAGESIVRSCNENGVKLLYGSILRFDPRYVMAHERVDAGEIGDIVSMTLDRTLPGYLCEDETGRMHPALTTTIHELDVVRWFLDGEVESISVKKDGQDQSGNLPQVLNVLLSSSRGTVVSVRTSMRGQGADIDERCVITGTDGEIKITSNSFGVSVKKGNALESPDLVHWPVIRGQLCGDLYWEIDHFVNSIVNDMEPLISANEGVRTLELALKVKDLT